ncbi:helix-hairpin-helix domain-containing protein [Streptomyces fulvorobeus]|uniref:helix-hairpin-helix domain-containing protein n=1 Tax=Streptomyces fulvorobeus TaxID=284028 RepID=UPI0035309E42
MMAGVAACGGPAGPPSHTAPVHAGGAELEPAPSALPAPAGEVRAAGEERERPGWRDRVMPALRERLPLWLQLRCGLEPRPLAALGVVMVAAAILAGTHFWSGRPQAVSAPEPVNDGPSAQAQLRVPLPEGSGPLPQPSAGPPPAGAAGGRIVVDVSGKVRRPGIQHLPHGSRVADALRAAGGVRDGTDVTGLNRARVLTDGEQVVVGMPAGPWSTGGAGGGGPGVGATGAAAPAAPVSLSTATVEQLETLPGVGPVLAQHIVDYRTQHGGYRSVDELREVDGIGDRRFEDLQPLVRP